MGHFQVIVHASRAKGLYCLLWSFAKIRLFKYIVISIHSLAFSNIRENHSFVSDEENANAKKVRATIPLSEMTLDAVLSSRCECRRTDKI
jgi:hypothetical protein